MKVTVSKTDKTISSVDASTVDMVSTDELGSVGNIQQMLCLNLVSGNIHEGLVEANSKRGGLARALPSWSNPDLTALRYCMDADAAQLLESWEADVSSKKRVRTISLQGMRKAHRAMFGDAPEAKASVKERFQEAWKALPAQTKASKAMVPMYDLAVELGWNPESKEFEKV